MKRNRRARKNLTRAEILSQADNITKQNLLLKALDEYPWFTDDVIRTKRCEATGLWVPVSDFYDDNKFPSDDYSPTPKDNDAVRRVCKWAWNQKVTLLLKDKETNKYNWVCNVYAHGRLGGDEQIRDRVNEKPESPYGSNLGWTLV